MDAEMLAYVLDQAAGVVIALILPTRIEKRLDTLIKDLEKFIQTLGNPL